MTKQQYHSNPWIRSVVLEMTPPSLSDNTADVDGLVKAIGKVLPGGPIVIDYPQYPGLSSALRKYG